MKKAIALAVALTLTAAAVAAGLVLRRIAEGLDDDLTEADDRDDSRAS